MVYKKSENIHCPGQLKKTTLTTLAIDDYYLLQIPAEKNNKIEHMNIFNSLLSLLLSILLPESVAEVELL